MKRTWSGVLVACVILAAVVGCRGGGVVYQVKDAPVQTASGKQATMDEVQKAIIGAGVALTWQMVLVQPGEIVGTLNVRSHQAVVSIPYTTKNYSILYKGSNNLKYNANKQTIHESYLGWIQRLDNAIRARLSGAGQ